MRCPCFPNMLRISTGAGTCRSEPVRILGVELGGFARAEHDVVFAEHEAERAGENVEPLVAAVRLEVDFRAPTRGS